ncbi:MAG: formimidoylglutamate deiminase [Deltaproteobacteria bacterium]|nr:MAG: formimidoylglutamate deiminase [Deltaproteobacteria bacterium]
MTVYRDGDELVLPGLATAHSHAFQRGLRGRTQRRQTEQGSFWSWRGLMYKFAERLDPASIYDLARFAYAELALSGVTAVGEFHYVQHQPDGTPYDDRVLLADAVISAARDVGLRICLLRVLYNRAGAGAPAEGAQKRFSDAKVEHALSDVLTLIQRFGGDPGVTIGVAPHSMRAVPREWIVEAHDFARDRGLPFHMHVAEQRREIEESIAEYGAPPVRLLAEDGVIDERFVAVHATHLEADEVKALGDAGAFACICRTTERDLGDGLCDAAALHTAGARLCTGVDSHAVSDPFEEARAIELDDRSRAEARVVAAEAPVLLEAMSENGYAAIGMEGASKLDRVTLDARDPALAGIPEDRLEDAVVFAASPRAVRNVNVGGRSVVWDGELPDWQDIRERFEKTTDFLTV